MLIVITATMFVAGKGFTFFFLVSQKDVFPFKIERNAQLDDIVYVCTQ